MLFGYPLHAVAAAGAILGVAATLQATVGFGLALLSIPLLHLAGFGPAEAIAVSGFAMLVQMTNGVIYLHAALDARRLALPLAIVMVALVLGVSVLRRLSRADPDLLRQGVGVVVVAIVLVQRLVKPRPRQRLGAGWTLAAMSTAGFLGGTTGMGGVPIALWSYAHEWPPRQIRASIWAIALPATALLLVLLGIAFGGSVWRAIATAAACAPFALAGSVLGLHVGGRLPINRLRTTASVVLILIGLSAIVRPLL